MRAPKVPPAIRYSADVVWRSRRALLILLHLLIGLLVVLAPRAIIAIPGSTIVHEQGPAYMAPLRHDWRLLYALPSDSLRALTNSRLKLYENGKELGPAHAPHGEIREQGGGRFSHWGDWLRFSTSDGSDPRTNGRQYSIASPTTLRTSWLVAVVVLDVGLLIAFRQQVLSFLRSGRGKRLLVGCGIGVVALAALAAFGVFGRVVVQAEGPPKDFALVVGAVGHAALGCAIALSAWAAGAGLVRTIVRDPRASLSSVLIPAFPVSLLALAVFVATALVVPHGRILAAVLWLSCLLPLVGWRPRRSAAIAAATALSMIIPPALLFGAWMGLLWHGPTATLVGLPNGDLAGYAAGVWSMAARGYPFINLGYEGAAPFPGFNVLFSGVGAMFVDLPGLDPFLFIAAGGGASYVLLSASMLHLFLRDRTPGRADAFAALILVLSVMAAGLYPSWVVISIPLVHAPALTISVWWLVSRRETGAALFAMAAGLIGSALSKVAAGGFLVPLAGAALWPRFRGSPPLARALFLGIAAVFAVYSASMLVRFVPDHFKAVSFWPPSFLSGSWEYLLRNAGMIAMTVVAWRIAESPVAVAVTLGLASAAVYPRLFFVNFVCATFVLGLIAFAWRKRSKGGSALTLLAFACPLPAVLLTDPTGTSAGLVWIICLGGATLAVLATSVRIVGAHRREGLAAAGLFTLVVVGAGAFGLLGIARGHILVDSGAKLMTPGLTPAVRDIWLAVRRQTPFDALIFTDQVADAPQGETPSLLGGWNMYAFAGQRQVYVSSHYTADELRFDAAKRREVLAVNDSVLRGAIAPSGVSTRRHYDSFFAVVRRSRPSPPGWEKLYENAEHALYSISPKSGS